MGKKRKTGRVQQQQSYQQMMAGQTLAKFKPYIDEQLQGAARAIAMQQSELLQGAFTRIRILEEILMKEIEYVDKEFLANKVAELEDQNAGLVVADSVEVGDTVRLSIKAKEEGQEYQDGTKLVVQQAGTGQTLGKILEDALVGMKTNEVKEIAYGQDNKMLAEITVNRISRYPKVEKTEAGNEDSNEG